MMIKMTKTKQFTTELQPVTREGLKQSNKKTICFYDKKYLKGNYQIMISTDMQINLKSHSFEKEKKRRKKSIVKCQLPRVQ